MNIIKFTERFHVMEEKTNLFNLKVDDLFWWDIVRYYVFLKIYYRISNIYINNKKRNVVRNVISFLNMLFKYVLYRSKMFLCSGSILIFRCPRNKSGTVPVDIISDPLIAICPKEFFVVNTFLSYFFFPFKMVPRKERQYSDRELGGINNIVSQYFDVNIDLSQFISEKIVRYERERKMYLALIRKVTPKCVMFIQNGIQKAMISAANQLKVPVVELQHGLINYVHPAYSYSPRIDYEHLNTFPGYIFTFSSCWAQNCFIPIKRRLVIGNDNLYCSSAQVETKTCLVVSADVYDSILRPMLKRMAASAKDWRFIYKLHPSQFQEFNSTTQDLKSFSNVQVVSDQKSIKELFGDVSVLLTIQSTTVYEALQAGKLVLLLKKLDYETHQDVFTNENVSLIEDEDQAVSAIRKLDSGFPHAAPTLFFDKFNKEVVIDFLSNLGVKIQSGKGS